MTTNSRIFLPLFMAAWLATLSCGCSEGPAPATTPSPADKAGTSNQQTKEQILQLSPRVADELRAMRQGGKLKESAIVRITVVEGNFLRFKTGGDKRYQYTLRLDDAPKNVDDDFVMESQGLTVHVARPSAQFLRGTEVIWIESGGKGGFKFLNPNEVSDDEANGQVINDLNTTQGPDTNDAGPQQTPTPR